MGRTVTAYSQQIEIVRDRFKKFRRSLRKEDQEIFDELMTCAKFHVQAGVMSACSNPMDGVILSVLLEMRREMRAQKSEIERLRGKIDALGDRRPPL